MDSEIDYSKEYDCFDYGCGVCKVCIYLNFIEWAESCAPPGSFIQRDKEMEEYLANKQKMWEAIERAIDETK